MANYKKLWKEFVEDSKKIDLTSFELKDHLHPDFWDGTNENGEAASSGVYFYHLVAKTERSAQNTEGVDFSDQHRFVILK